MSHTSQPIVCLCPASEFRNCSDTECVNSGANAAEPDDDDEDATPALDPEAGVSWYRGFLARLDNAPRHPSQNKDWHEGWLAADDTIKDALKP